MKKFATFLTGLAAIGTVAVAQAPDATGNPSIRVLQLGPDRFELVYSGSRFTSRDGIERELLLGSARLALAHDQQAFELLAMPGEATDVHPARPHPAFGDRYGHWQPHWNYYVPQLGWQWWHPEWGADFWTGDVSPGTVERFEVHAIIKFAATTTRPSGDLRFSAPEIVRELGQPDGVHAQHHER